MAGMSNDAEEEGVDDGDGEEEDQWEEEEGNAGEEEDDEYDIDIGQLPVSRNRPDMSLTALSSP